jgi:hypothetical protein
VTDLNPIQRWFVRREERKHEPPVYRAHEHHYVSMGGGGGWEVLECKVCGRSDIPSPFGFMWANLRILQWINPTLRCSEENGGTRSG